MDHYETWLGIPPDRRPPTHYDLLGLAPFASDPSAIEQAALRRMGKVRQHQIGPHSDQPQEILSELARHRLILIDPDRRAEYDARLRAAGDSRTGLTEAPEQNVKVEATRRQAELADCPPRVLVLPPIRGSGRNGLLTPTFAARESPAFWQQRLATAVFIAIDAVLIGCVCFSIYAPRPLQGNHPVFVPDNRPEPIPKPAPIVKPPVPPNRLGESGQQSAHIVTPDRQKNAEAELPSPYELLAAGDSVQGGAMWVYTTDDPGPKLDCA